MLPAAKNSTDRARTSDRVDPTVATRYDDDDHDDDEAVARWVRTVKIRHHAST